MGERAGLWRWISSVREEGTVFCLASARVGLQARRYRPELPIDTDRSRGDAHGGCQNLGQRQSTLTDQQLQLDVEGRQFTTVVTSGDRYVELVGEPDDFGADLCERRRFRGIEGVPTILLGRSTSARGSSRVAPFPRTPERARRASRANRAGCYRAVPALRVASRRSPTRTDARAFGGAHDVGEQDRPEGPVGSHHETRPLYFHRLERVKAPRLEAPRRHADPTRRTP